MLLLRGGRVLQEDGLGFRPADVLVQDNRIVAVQPGQTPPAGGDVWELAGDLVIPGLVNAHYHSPDNLNTGRLPVAPLELWSLVSVPSRRDDSQSLRAAALLGAAQLLRGGVTAVVDMVRPAPALTLEALEAVAQAYLDVGLRAAIVPVVADLPIAETLPLPNCAGAWSQAPAAGTPEPSAEASHAESTQRQLAIVDEFFRRWHGRDGRILVQVGPSGPQRCSDALLASAIELARERKTLLHTHALETRAQAEQARRRWGEPMLRHLDRLGALAPSTVLAHVVWPEPGEIELLAQRGAVVTHNPASNCALGGGRAPLPALLAAGATVALGTDAATCNDGLSVFEAMKLATILHRPSEPDWRRWPTPSTALRLATAGGAAALGLASQLGRVAPGCLADLVVLDASASAFVPPNDLVHQLVMRAGPETVRHVLVGGRPLVRNRELLSLDWQTVADVATRLAAVLPNRTVPPRAPEPLEEAITRMLTELRAVIP